MTTEQEKLVLENQHLIPKIVGRCLRLIGGGIALHAEDLVSEGYLALIEAAKKYDSTKDVSFKYLTNLLVPYRIIDYLRRIDALTKLERKLLKKDLATRQVTAKSKSLQLREPGWVEQLPVGRLSLNDAQRTEKVVVWEKIDTHTPEIDVNRKEALHLIKSLGLKYLGKRNLEILLDLYIKEDPAVDLAKKHDVNESYISQVKTKNLAVLKKQLARRGYSQLNHLL